MAPRGSYLIVPGLRESDLEDPPKSIEDAIRADPGAVVVDLEDGVGPGMKELARERTVDALSGQLDRDSTYVRVNGVGTEYGFDDLEALASAPVSPDGVVVPEVQSAADVRTVEQFLEAVGSPIGVIPLIERPAAVFEARAIAAAPRVEALVFGSVDFRKYMGMPTLADSPEIALPRYVVSMAASAAGVSAIDTVYLHHEDTAGLRAEAEHARSIGFDAKLATSVGQIPVIEEAFAPSPEEVARAERILEAFEDAGDDVGLITVDGITIDKPVAEELEALLERAAAAGVDADRDGSAAGREQS